VPPLCPVAQEEASGWHLLPKRLQPPGHIVVRCPLARSSRHAAASPPLEIAVQARRLQRVVQEALGHSTLAVTKRYTHLTTRLVRDAAERMEKHCGLS
jgi:integrase